MTDFPQAAEPIFVEWATREGGITVTAFTDKKGNPFIGIYSLNRMGEPDGLPCWLRRSCFMSDVVIGFNGKTPIVISINAQVTARGLELVVHLPQDIAPRGYERRLSAPWGSAQPRFGFRVVPTGYRVPVDPFPSGDF